MARIRTIKPEFWSHPVMGKLDDATKCLALALLNFSDDEGYFLADPVLVRSFARPFDEDSTITQRGLAQLEKSDWIEVSEHPSHGAIGRVVNFTSHQNVDRGKPSKIKEYFESSNDRRMIVDESALEQGTGNREVLIPTEPLPKRSRKARGGEDLGNYPQELEQAMDSWRHLRASLTSDEIRGQYKPEKVFIASSIGTREAVWTAWRKRLAVTVRGRKVTNAHVLAAVELWSEALLERGKAGEGCSCPMLPTLINKADFVDALVTVMDDEVPHAS